VVRNRKATEPWVAMPAAINAKRAEDARAYAEEWHEQHDIPNGVTPAGSRAAEGRGVGAGQRVWHGFNRPW
jgi:hypothetical protein